MEEEEDGARGRLLAAAGHRKGGNYMAAAGEHDDGDEFESVIGDWRRRVMRVSGRRSDREQEQAQEEEEGEEEEDDVLDSDDVDEFPEDMKAVVQQYELKMQQHQRNPAAEWQSLDSSSTCDSLAM